MGQAESEHGIGFQAEKSGVGVVVDGASGPFGQVSGVPDVIPVAMGKEKGVGFNLFLFQEFQKTFRSVDGKAVAVHVDQVGVGGGKAACVKQRFKHRSSAFRLDEDED